MSKSKKNTEVIVDLTEEQKIAIAEATPAVPAEPVIKETPVEERKYELTSAAREDEALKFRGKQRQVVFEVLKAATEALTYTEVAREAEKLELKAVGGVDLSCRYHLHHMTLDGYTSVVNPTIVVE